MESLVKQEGFPEFREILDIVEACKKDSMSWVLSKDYKVAVFVRINVNFFRKQQISQLSEKIFCKVGRDLQKRRELDYSNNMNSLL